MRGNTIITIQQQQKGYKNQELQVTYCQNLAAVIQCLSWTVIQVHGSLQLVQYALCVLL